MTRSRVRTWMRSPARSNQLPPGPKMGARTMRISPTVAPAKRSSARLSSTTRPVSVSTTGRRKSMR